ncbi:hypothetical protein jhhlp_007542 [Lomentospora prolificans]|uniref:Uncharacterized protein n=1 Tax=Lomentospora prolificans TaxID=41688 RepID=A0A2N3MZV8_9PEZI|nr:hypothetical protein jhhlp_007542 [Lomentospora prolificans]
MRGGTNGKSDLARTAGQSTPRSSRAAQGTSSAVEGGRGSVEIRVRSEDRFDSAPFPETEDQSTLERRKAQIVDNVMSMLMEWLNASIPPLQERDGGNRSRGTAESGSKKKSGSDRRGGDPDEDKENNGGRRSNKRQQREESPDGHDGGDGGRGGGKGTKRARKESNDGERKFACPFYKHDPSRCLKSRACAPPGFPSLHRLKCQESLGSEKALNAHLRSDDRCEKVDEMPWYGITEAQEAAIRARPGKEKGSEEERWKDIYKIIFPDALDTPTPYYDEEPALAGVRQYLRQELPPLVRRELEEEVERKLSCVEADMKREAINLIQRLACRLIQSYPGRQADKNACAPTPRSRSRSRSPETIYCDPPASPNPVPGVPSHEDPLQFLQEIGLYEGEFALGPFMEPLQFTDFNGVTTDSQW